MANHDEIMYTGISNVGLASFIIIESLSFDANRSCVVIDYSLINVDLPLLCDHLYHDIISYSI
jgi:hypothetical protein